MDIAINNVTKAGGYGSLRVTESSWLSFDEPHVSTHESSLIYVFISLLLLFVNVGTLNIYRTDETRYFKFST